MIQIRKIAFASLVVLIASYSALSYAATIIVNTTDMTIDANEGIRVFISQDTSGYKQEDLPTKNPDGTPFGRSGLYSASTLTISDLNDLNKNPADNETGLGTPADITDDSPAISLPEAIIAANNTPGADTIVLSAGETYTLDTIHNYWYGPNALPPITSQIEIFGDGLGEGVRPQTTDRAAIIQRDTGAPNMRVFFVMGGTYSNIVTGKAQVGQGVLSLVNLHIKDGYAQGGHGSGGGAGLGGAIFNQGLLSVSGVTFSNNTAAGGNGSNTVGLGGGSVGGDASGELGGGFYSTEFIGSEQFIHPSDTNLDTFTSIFGGNGGVDGSGGFGPLNDNGVNGGGLAATNSSHASLGAFGAGGGRAAKTPTEDGNAGAFASGGGYGVTGGAGGFGGGGGQSSSASNESIAGFAGGKGTSVSGGGGAGLGGAIFNHTGIVAITNSTFSGNQAIGGNGDFGGSAYGAAIFSANAQSFSGRSGLNIFHSTIFDNICVAGSGTNGVCSSPVYTIGITGPGVQDGNVDATATIANTIIANPVGITYASLGNSKEGTNSGSTLTLTGKNIVRNTIFNGPDAVLSQNLNDTFDTAPFANSEALDVNAGLTPTIVPSNTSPAINAADNDATILAIQTGFGDLSLDQHRKPRLKAFIETNAAPATPTTEEIQEVLDLLPSNIGAVETGANTAPEIIFLTKDEDGNEKNPEVPDNSSSALSSLFSIRDLDDLFLQSGFDMQLDLSITDGNGTLKINTANIISTREAGLEFESTPAFSVIEGTETPSTVSLTSISIKAPLSTISSALSRIVFEPTIGLGEGDNDSSEIAITIDDLGISGDAPSPSLTDNKTLQITIVGTPPTVGIGSTVDVVGNTSFQVVVAFGEQVSGFAISDIKTTNANVVGSLTTLVDDQIFQVNIQANGQGDVEISVPADVVEDPLGLKNKASNIVTVIYDINKPTISTSGIPAIANDDEFTASFVFDEEVAGFTVEDIQITNAELSDFEEVDARTYKAVVTPNLIGAIRFSIKENIASDAAGNGNKALTEQLIPLQVGGEGSSSSYSPLFSLLILILFTLRRRTKP